MLTSTSYCNNAPVTLAQGRPQIMVAEDNPTTRKLMVYWLESSGYTVVQAEDGTKAWETAQSNCPPIVVTDWNMPRMSGIDLCKHIRNSYRPDSVYLLIATSRDEGDDLDEAMKAGANDFLSKPVRQDELIARIQCAEKALLRSQEQSALADTDPLTGLLNRRGFFSRGQRLLENCNSEGQALCCLLLDVDLFKKFNDEHGHATGDEVLRIVSRSLQKETRNSDIICRLGGDEFCVLLYGVAEARGLAIAERIRSTLSHPTQARLESVCKSIPMTIGVVENSGDYKSIDDLIHAADLVLREAKKTGRNRSSTFREFQDRNSPQAQQARRQEQAILEHQQVSQWIESKLETIDEHQGIDSALELFTNRQAEFLCVVNMDSEVVGVVTERELIAAVFEGALLDASVKTIVTCNYLSFRLSDSLQHVWENYKRTPMNQILIVDENNHPIGQFKAKSLLRLICG